MSYTVNQMSKSDKPPTQQPREYTFSCDCCDNKCKVTMYNSIPPDCGCLINSDIGAIWKSRPHPAPASSAIEDITPEGAAIIQEVKRQAREDVLDNICHNCGGLADGAEQCNSCYVKSLRGGRES